MLSLILQMYLHKDVGDMSGLRILHSSKSCSGTWWHENQPQVCSLTSSPLHHWLIPHPEGFLWLCVVTWTACQSSSNTQQSPLGHSSALYYTSSALHQSVEPLQKDGSREDHHAGWDVLAGREFWEAGYLKVSLKESCGLPLSCGLICSMERNAAIEGKKKKKKKCPGPTAEAPLAQI